MGEHGPPRWALESPVGTRGFTSGRRNAFEAPQDARDRWSRTVRTKPRSGAMLSTRRMKMPERWKVSLVAVASLLLLAMAIPAMAGVPDQTKSFFVPQAGTTTSPVEGTDATKFFRMCPNNDGGASLFNHARLKVTLLDVNGNGIPGVAAA